MPTYVQPDGEPDGTQYFQDVELSPDTLANGSLLQRFDTVEYPRLGVTAAGKEGSGTSVPAAPTPANGGAPGAPTAVVGTKASATSVSVAFTPPASEGGSPETSYTATSTPGGLHASGAGSPLVVTGLTTGTAYTFTVTATNAEGTGPASAASAAVTPS
jgi:hypothetical protein